jgi:hypothetical protein
MLSTTHLTSALNEVSMIYEDMMHQRYFDQYTLDANYFHDLDEPSVLRLTHFMASLSINLLHLPHTSLTNFS